MKYFVLLVYVHTCTSMTASQNSAVAFSKALTSKCFTPRHGLSFSECRWNCARNESCHSVDYFRLTHTCRMHGFLSDSEYELTTVPGMVHVRVKDGIDTSNQNDRCKSSQTWDEANEVCIYTVLAECKNRLVANSSGVIAKNISASSTYPPYWMHDPMNATLDSPSAWAADANDTNRYIQVEFHRIRWVTGVVTQGRNDDPFFQWVKSYQMAFSRDCCTFKDLRNNSSNITVFDGNNDRDSNVTHMLDISFDAKCVRLKPKTWEKHPSMRFDILGCDPTE